MFTRLSGTLLAVAILAGNSLALPSGFPVGITSGPRPQPVMVNGRNHFVYELHLTNVAPIPIEVVKLNIFGDEESKPLASYRGEALARLTTPAENLLTTMKADDVAKAQGIAGGGSVIIFLDVALEADTRPPGELHHQFTFDIHKNPDLDRTVNGPTIAVIPDPPPILRAPLRGSGWVAFNALAMIDHRRAFQTVDGKLCIAQRFAIDWQRLGPDGRLFRNDPKSNENFYGYGAEVLAVADARVSSLRDNVPDNGGTNERSNRHVTVDSAVGNYVTLDFGTGQFALYAHLQPKSIKVKVGDKVKAGQVVALLGNSGNSDAPHLHFQVTDGDSPLGAEGLPYELESFTQTGTVAGATELINAGQTWHPKPEERGIIRHREFPANNAVLTFP